MKHTVTINKIDEKILKNDLLDIQNWIDACVVGKVNKCKKRLVKEWLPQLMADPSVTSIPANEDDIVDMIIQRSDYKSRVQRNEIDQVL